MRNITEEISTCLLVATMSKKRENVSCLGHKSFCLISYTNKSQKLLNNVQRTPFLVCMYECYVIYVMMSQLIEIYIKRQKK